MKKEQEGADEYSLRQRESQGKSRRRRRDIGDSLHSARDAEVLLERAYRSFLVREIWPAYHE
jgi:hypothetical protein